MRFEWRQVMTELGKGWDTFTTWPLSKREALAARSLRKTDPLAAGYLRF